MATSSYSKSAGGLGTRIGRIKDCLSSGPCSSTGAAVVSKAQNGVFFTVKSRDFLESEGRLGLDLLMQRMERKQQKFSLKRELKIAEAVPVQRRGRQTVRKTPVVVVNDEENLNSGSPAAVERR